jgi:hypothetical protein
MDLKNMKKIKLPPQAYDEFKASIDNPTPLSQDAIDRIRGVPIKHSKEDLKVFQSIIELHSDNVIRESIAIQFVDCLRRSPDNKIFFTKELLNEIFALDLQGNEISPKTTSHAAVYFMLMAMPLFKPHKSELCVKGNGIFRVIDIAKAKKKTATKEEIIEALSQDFHTI